MKTILLSGANGFIASSFVRHYAKQYRFILLSHKPQANHCSLDELAADPKLIRQIDVIINLAGANIAAKRWSVKRKEQLIASRLTTSQRLVTIFNQAASQAHFISASAVGIYDTDKINNEETPLNYHRYANFSQQITKEWESAVLKYQGSTTITRFGVVLAALGGAFPQLLRPFLFGVGGCVGDGQQYFPWIALPDLLAALELLIEGRHCGTFTLVAPHMVKNCQLSQTIAEIWRRPNWLPFPKTLVRLVFGQMGSELFLNSLQVEPVRLLKLGFKFDYPDLASCLTAIKQRQF